LGADIKISKTYPMLVRIGLEVDGTTVVASSFVSITKAFAATAEVVPSYAVGRVFLEGIMEIGRGGVIVALLEI
jgi:hypothetical protein